MEHRDTLEYSYANKHATVSPTFLLHLLNANNCELAYCAVRN